MTETKNEAFTMRRGTSARSGKSSRNCKLDSPDRAAIVERTLPFDESGGHARENPYAYVRELPQEARQGASDPKIDGVNHVRTDCYWRQRWPVHETRVECQSLPTTKTISTDKTIGAPGILRKILLRHFNLRAKHESCNKPIVDRVRRGG